MNNSEKRKLKLERRRKIEKDRSVNELIAKKTVSVDKSMFGIETPKRPKDFYQRQRRMADEHFIIEKQERADRLKFLAEKAKKNKAGSTNFDVAGSTHESLEPVASASANGSTVNSPDNLRRLVNGGAA